MYWHTIPKNIKIVVKFLNIKQCTGNITAYKVLRYEVVNKIVNNSLIKAAAPRREVTISAIPYNKWLHH